MAIRLLALINRSIKLYCEQGLAPVASESEAADFMSRSGNSDEPIKVIVGPHALFATCSRGYTDPLPIAEGEGPEEVRALGEIAKIILLHALRKQSAAA